jgi:hypothetical protein
LYSIFYLKIKKNSLPHFVIRNKLSLRPSVLVSGVTPLVLPDA